MMVGHKQTMARSITMDKRSMKKPSTKKHRKCSRVSNKHWEMVKDVESMGRWMCRGWLSTGRRSSTCRLEDVVDTEELPSFSKAAKLEPNDMPARYAIAVHHIRDVVRTQCSDDQLLWAANEMATVLKGGDPSKVDAPIAWAGLAMAHRAQHEIVAVYNIKNINLNDAEERAQYTLKQAIQEDPYDVVQWHQLDLYNICMTRFSESVNFLKAALARSPYCSYAWSNLALTFGMGFLQGKGINVTPIPLCS